jgi:cystathionine beta-lyase/cystathionine gamma-synthase
VVRDPIQPAAQGGRYRENFGYRQKLRRAVGLRQHLFIALSAATAGTGRGYRRAFGNQVFERSFGHARRRRRDFGSGAAGVAAISAAAPDWVVERITFMQNALGAVLGAAESSLLLRSIKTLPLRMQRHCENARQVAEHFVENQDRYQLEAVHYPGLPDHPGYDVAARQMKDFGAIVTLHVHGGIERADRILRGCELFKFAVSLGGVESLIQHPASLTHDAVPKEKRDRVGVTDNLVRLSVGIEDAGDLIADLEQAFMRGL